MNRHTFSFPRTATTVALALVVLAAVLMAGCTRQTGSVASVVTQAPSSSSPGST